MVNEVEDIRVILKSMLRTVHNGSMKLQELEYLFKTSEGTELQKVAGSLGFRTIEDMIRRWNEFKVFGSGLGVTVVCNDLDHISRLNKFSKSTNKKSFCGLAQLYHHTESDANPRLLLGPDPYAFSLSDSDSEKSLGYADSSKYLELVKSSRMVPTQKYIRSVDKTIPQSKPLEQIPGKFLVIFVLEVANPHRFWFAENSDVKKLQEVMLKMQKFYDKNDQTFKVAQKDVQEKLYVAGLYMDMWHRGRIIKSVSPTTVRVFFVDFGTVDDVKCDSIRYLMEKFAELPLLLRRGVLSHVQPTTGRWRTKAIEYFKKQIMEKKIKAKILDKKSHDSSYNLALKIDDGQLISDAMMSNGFCVYDEKDLDFDEYEKGKFLEESLVTLEEQNSWLPSATFEKLDANVPAKVKDSFESEEVTFDNSGCSLNRSLLNSSPAMQQAKNLPVTQARYSPRVRLEDDKKVTSGYTALSSSSSSFLSFQNIRNNGSCTVSNLEHQHKAPKKIESRKPRQIVNKSFKKLKIEEKMKICIHQIEDTQNFYFFVMDEFDSLRTFFKDFNDAYTRKSTPNADFTEGSDVVTYSDDNFCRGRILKEKNNGNSYELLLFDFGVTIERERSNIFILEDKWMNQQAAVYQGKLKDVQRNQYSSKEKLYEKTKDRFVDAKISKVEHGVVEIGLID